MLFKTSKNIAKELVDNLIDISGKGLLTDITQSGLAIHSNEADNGEDELDSYIRSGKNMEANYLK
jgi:hypothetical protein